jgi:hypothetical protein
MSRAAAAAVFADRQMMNPDLTLADFAITGIREREPAYVEYACDEGYELTWQVFSRAKHYPHHGMFEALLRSLSDAHSPGAEEKQLLGEAFVRLMHRTIPNTSCQPWHDLQCVEMLRLLATYGMDVDFVDDFRGDTLLMLAVRRKQTLTALALIRAGADIQARNRDGENAESIARKMELAKVIEAL